MTEKIYMISMFDPMDWEMRTISVTTNPVVAATTLNSYAEKYFGIKQYNITIYNSADGWPMLSVPLSREEALVEDLSRWGEL